MKPEAGDKPTFEVLFEDNHLIAVCKPAGLLTQADQSGQPNLLDEVKHWLAVQYRKPGNVFLGMLHRLDRPVAGVVLFAKTSKAASRLSEQFRKRSVTKIYLARVHGVMRPAKGRLVHFHRHDEGERAVRLFDTASESTKIASLIYETRWVDHAESVLEVQLETGRKHQIRAQLAHVGHPIVGDALYGSQRQHRDARISLCARQLTVEHPISKLPLTVCMPPELVPPELRSKS
ncbi:MAG TPA: RluA family pseudouridine synthase [Polyangiales bacterium]|nr:RluA family pseudouridine synthase [Polyangiales bacterium]